MFDLGWTELLLVGVVALIVVGPKDLPVMFRAVGQFVGKARGMAREFTRAMDDAAEQSGVGDIKASMKAATDPVNDALAGVRDAARSFNELASDAGKLPAEAVAEQNSEDAARIRATTARAAADRKIREADAARKAADEAEAELSGLGSNKSVAAADHAARGTRTSSDQEKRAAASG